MTIEQTIQKAIEGGYDASRFVAQGDTVETWLKMDAVNDKEFWLLDPIFWQSLGKAMGWPKETKEVQLDGFNLEAMDNGVHPTTKGFEYNWQYHWHRFIDHLAEGKDAESFFESL